MRYLLVAFLSAMMASPVAAQAPGGAATTAPKVAAGPFDPTRDSARDLEAAKAEAHKSGRRILLDVGGNWCSWCRLMDKWFTEHAAAREARDKAFVVVPVNFSPENKNEAFLGQFPKVDGYPHFFVLDADGKLVRDQSTGDLEDGRGYSEAKMTAFIKEWSGK
ncbi:MAG TPA: thioredoxin family protein [Holophagaceae bacterium]|jgi:thiol:disulfide interchange protein|nr:thioredoxin family protein [Holophagaceae bacterium]